MIVGIGVDTVEIKRMEKSLASPAFMKKVFGTQEQLILEQRTGKRKLEGAAGNFAAKEAFLKAMGTGIGGFALHEIETVREEGGKPRLVLSGMAKKSCDEQGLRVHLSITHEGGFATAFVVVEKAF